MYHEPTDIEKKSLEAHVELCAERYKLLETKLANVVDGVEETKGMIRGLSEKFSTVSEKDHDRLIKWGVGIIATLAAACGWLLTHYIGK